VTSSGQTLYRFTPDKANDPTCTGGCATEWPPLLLSGGQKSVKGLSGLSSVKLADGKHQVTYDKIPLYRYILDTKAGDTLGQGIGGTWYVVKPGTKLAATTKSTSSSGGYGY
jgi:predicted lipoprotein with Yx(FWY)xxD motif